jgi:sRNA-binding regulator protein Hfq
MANPSPISMPDARPARSVDSGAEAKSAASENQVAEDMSSSQTASVIASGPRKLVRPTLPARALGSKYFSRRKDSSILAHHEMKSAYNGPESSHAEEFYFQKQMQTQTLMVFILEDGERIEGYIEWYDRDAIKVKNHTRTLIYKSSIKYLYKASENHQHG